jgi:hypothetical protein
MASLFPPPHLTTECLRLFSIAEMGREILDDEENKTLTDYALLAELINRRGCPY